MDAIQAFVKEKRSQEIGRFVVTGASKRGWTTWLTGAVDPRVAAIAPMVIDVLNMKEQMPHQVRSFGGYSEKIADYSEKNLPDKLQRPEAKVLLDLVDPYSYRAKLTMPKLILLGTNDRYWPVDAVKLYFGGLPGEKHIHYVPNKGHGLGADAVVAVAAFYDGVLRGESLPRFRWTSQPRGGGLVLRIMADDPPVSARLWRAVAPTRDFRDSAWSSEALRPDSEGRFVATVPTPDSGYAAVFGQLTYRSPLGFDYTLSTNVDVLEPTVAPRPMTEALSR
jgi:PhoPQ-activated pathogenicity-related protein